MKKLIIIFGVMCAGHTFCNDDFSIHLTELSARFDGMRKENVDVLKKAGGMLLSRDKYPRVAGDVFRRLYDLSSSVGDKNEYGLLLLRACDEDGDFERLLAESALFVFEKASTVQKREFVVLCAGAALQLEGRTAEGVRFLEKMPEGMSGFPVDLQYKYANTLWAQVNTKIQRNDDKFPEQIKELIAKKKMDTILAYLGGYLPWPSPPPDPQYRKYFILDSLQGVFEKEMSQEECKQAIKLTEGINDSEIKSGDYIMQTIGMARSLAFFQTNDKNAIQEGLKMVAVLDEDYAIQVLHILGSFLYRKGDSETAKKMFTFVKTYSSDLKFREMADMELKAIEKEEDKNKKNKER